MKVLVGQDIAVSQLAGSSIPAVDTASGEIAWAVGTYVVGDIRNYGDKRWYCVKDHTSTASDPKPDQDPTRWDPYGPTNLMAPFDEYLFTKAKQQGSMTYKIAAQFATGFAVHDVTAEKLEWRMYITATGETLVYNGNPVAGSYDFWEQAYGHFELLFGNLARSDSLAVDKLPLRPDCTLELVFTRDDPSEFVTVGFIGVGTPVNFYIPNTEVYGTQYGVEYEIKSFTQYEEAFDGTEQRMLGYSAKRIRGKCLISKEQGPEAAGVLRKVVDRPVYVELSDLPSYTHLITVGYLRGTVVSPNFGSTEINFKIDGKV